LFPNMDHATMHGKRFSEDCISKIWQTGFAKRVDATLRESKVDGLRYV
jgi:hypothetical protein